MLSINGSSKNNFHIPDLVYSMLKKEAKNYRETFQTYNPIKNFNSVIENEKG